MATKGNLPPSPVNTGYTNFLGPSGICVEITMTEDGTAGSIWFWGDAAASANIYAAIFDSSDDSLVTYESAPLATGAGGSLQWWEIPLTGAALANSGTYFLSVASPNTNAGTLYFGQSGDDNFVGAGDDYMFFNGAWPDPCNGFPNGTPRDYPIYLEYTESAGGILIPIVRHNQNRRRR